MRVSHFDKDGHLSQEIRYFIFSFKLEVTIMPIVSKVIGS